MMTKEQIECQNEKGPKCICKARNAYGEPPPLHQNNVGALKVEDLKLEDDQQEVQVEENAQLAATATHTMPG